MIDRFAVIFAYLEMHREKMKIIDISSIKAKK